MASTDSPSDASGTESINPVVDLETLEATEDVDGRTKKAHDENMVVLPETDEYGIVHKSNPSYTVVSESGSEYDVDPYGGCTCPDATFNSPENGCKHGQRLVEELNRGRVPEPGAEVHNWMEEVVVERIEAGESHLSALEDAQEAASDSEASDYDDPIDVTETILAALRSAYEDYRERIEPNAPEI